MTTLYKKFPQVAVIGEEDGDTGENKPDEFKVLDKIHPDVLAKTFPEHLQNVAPERVSDNLIYFAWITPLDQKNMKILDLYMD